LRRGIRKSATPPSPDSILDRLVHNAHRIELKGESMRKKRNGKTVEEKS
jgi:DNA replication protein DnaC